MDFADHCDQITTQTALLALLAREGDLTATVPSVGGWTIAQLLRHVGGGHRWAEETVRTRASAPLPDTQVRDLDAYPAATGPELGAWLVEGATALVAALRDAGPDAQVWAPVTGGGSSFYARRFAHETLVHRADGELALGRPFAPEAATAIDAIEEWLELGSLPVMLDLHPHRRALLGPGRTVHLHAHDCPEAEWVVDLTGEHPSWRRAHEKSTVAVRAPLTDLLLLVYRRRPAEGLEVLGDGALLAHWLENNAFG